MSNEHLPHTPATTPRLTKAQRRTLRRREQRAREAEAAQRAREAEAAQRAKGTARLLGRDGGRSTAPASQDDSKNDRKEPQFPQLSGAARRALSRTTVSSTDIKAIRVTQTHIEAERQRKSADRDTELRRRTQNRRLPKR
jgi:hypothetical protein